jgi:hypothetical protein
MVTQTSDAKISIGGQPILNWREIDNFIDFLQKNHNPSSRAPYHKRKQLWQTFALKLFVSHATRIVISIQLQIKYSLYDD